MQENITSDLHPGLSYNYKLGVFYRLVLQENNKQEVLRILDDGRTLVKGRIVVPDMDGFLKFTCTVAERVIKLKAIRVAYEMFHNTKRPNGMIVYPKDMNETNLRINNIGVLSVELWSTVKDAVHNISGGIKITPHSTNAYSFVLTYRKNGRNVQRTTHDITKALQLKRKITIESYKIATKYTVTH